MAAVMTAPAVSVASTIILSPVIPVMTAPAVSVAPTITLSTFLDTFISGYGDLSIEPYDGDELLTVVNWNANAIEVTAPTAIV
jgi:hypothetical protein